MMKCSVNFDREIRAVEYCHISHTFKLLLKLPEEVTCRLFPQVPVLLLPITVFALLTPLGCLSLESSLTVGGQPG